ncbi:MAG: HAMP domain-containing protein [Sterolibacteriaceae bacterium]|uniref:histidine kinase n=1 Tax=Candidatus Methylophosphatis roskildensis TaxID=2899263 RepID=A0A9D7E3C0_9PROT|nr:HAMP domain-containing protein [Candidatus Methylophosphatis roskildensis]MBK7237626.1 HAMP domain-containing protein [Sterolibacteriaceae bacterium]
MGLRLRLRARRHEALIALRRVFQQIRFVPSTLLWRTFMLIAALMLASVLAWFRVYAFYEREPRAQQGAQTVVSIVNLTRAALVSADPAARRELLFELSDQEGIRVYPTDPKDVLTPLTDRPVLNLLVDKVRAQLGEATRFANAVDNDEGFWVSFRIDGDEYWIALPRERIERKFPLEWVGWGLAALALALAGSYLIVFRVTHPLKALTSAARTVSRAQTPDELDESGPTELATVARAFNRMSRSLAQQQADRALILAGISHDLRTPLARLRLGIELSGADPPTRQGMEADIDEMDKIIGQFLEFARQDDPSQGGESADRIDLKRLVGEVAEPYLKRGADLKADLAELPPVPGRPLALRRLLANLVDNALRHAGETRPIEIGLRQTGEHAVLSVSDRGPGIPPAQVERMKRPFTRLDSARGNAKGSGLGLAIVDRIARNHGGELKLVARDGGGLTAEVLLPIGQIGGIR